jgi:hypothetical protein
MPFSTNATNNGWSRLRAGAWKGGVQQKRRKAVTRKREMLPEVARMAMAGIPTFCADSASNMVYYVRFVSLIGIRSW